MRVAMRFGMRSLMLLLPIAALVVHCGGTTDSPLQQSSDCDALMHGTFTCHVDGEKCESPSQVACINAPTLYCTCESGTFVCDVPSPTCGEPPQTKCPPPQDVQPGAPCPMSAGTCASDLTVQDCNGTTIGNVRCSCGSNGFYECEAPPLPPCAVDAGAGG